jgi:hypothetical protein
MATDTELQQLLKPTPLTQAFVLELQQKSSREDLTLLL